MYNIFSILENILYMLQGIAFEYTFCLVLVSFSLYLFYVIMSEIFVNKKIFRNNKEMRMKEWEKYNYSPDITFFRLKQLNRRRKSNTKEGAILRQKGREKHRQLEIKGR